MQTRATQVPTNSEKQGNNLARTHYLEIVPEAPGRGKEQSRGLLLVSERWVCECVDGCSKHGIGSKEREIWGCERWVLGDSEEEGQCAWWVSAGSRESSSREGRRGCGALQVALLSLLLPTQTCPYRKKVNAARLKKVKGEVEGGGNYEEIIMLLQLFKPYRLHVAWTY